MPDDEPPPFTPLHIELDPDMDWRALGQLLRAARLQAQLTQAELGRRMGVVQNTIARIEAGKSPPTLVTLSKFACAAGYSPRIELKRRQGMSAASKTSRKGKPPSSR